ncbi:mesoderm induction early response protein 2-like [Pollicipes pollicipes]|uniref:mesoderm induction early response protein 2-like n=1 Tax=Pollicipes pollicipes TaxID=41117 RepID=UPI0018849CBA|nr:mesoderm induction early response protein 2-like [Pollicipes pollicipes]
MSIARTRGSQKMADPSVGWCERLTPCGHAQPWAPAPEPGAAELLPAEPDPAIERLLALYTGGGSGRLADDDADASQSSSASEEILSNQDLTLDKAVIARDLLGEFEPSGWDGEAEPALLRPERAPPEPSPPPAPLWRKPVPLGRLAEREVERYQRRLRPAADGDTGSVSDQEQALFQLQECGHNVEEALRRVQPVQPRPADRLALWSDAECELFEEGLRLYGKDFHAIQRQKVRTRSSSSGGGEASDVPSCATAGGAASSSLQIVMAPDPWEPGRGVSVGELEPYVPS